jgi:dTDP-4-amino-4,6-dideoxygalactose transaminase
MTLKVRYRDLSVTDPNHRKKLMKSIERVFDNGTFIMGSEVEDFEKKFAQMIGVPHAIGLSSGTNALYLALKALDIGPGDEVITSPMSWIATLNAIHLVGATPVFVDIGDDLNINPVKIKPAITKNTKAILPVHYNGLLCDMVQIINIAEDYNLLVVEDAAQAVGAEVPGGKAGSFGHASAYSLNPMKVFCGYGDAGAVTTANPNVVEQLECYRYLGTIDKEVCVKPELNHKIDSLLAALLVVNMEFLPKWINIRRKHATHYHSRLGDLFRCPNLPINKNDRKNVFYDYTILALDRDNLMQHLISRGIEVKIKHPILMPDQPAYAHLTTTDIPLAREHVKHILTLPIHEKLTADDIDFVCDSVLSFRG